MDHHRPHLTLVDENHVPVAADSLTTQESLRFLAPGEYHRYVSEFLDGKVRRLPTRNDDPPPLAA